MTDQYIEDQHIATLVHADEFAKNLNQVASVSTNKLIFVKRKNVSLAPFELLEFPISECSSITYEVKWAIVSMIFGAFLTISILLVFAFGSVPAGTRVPIGATAFVFFLGAVLLRGPKRHCLTFLVSGKKLKWQSKPGDFKYKIASTQKIIAFARERGLLKNAPV